MTKYQDEMKEDIEKKGVNNLERRLRKRSHFSGGGFGGCLRGVWGVWTNT